MKNLKNMKKAFAISLLLCFIHSLANGQIDTSKPLYHIGVFGGINYNIQSAGFRSLPGIPNCCPKFESGSGVAPQFGLSLRYPLDEAASLVLKIGYNDYSGKLQKDEFIGNSELREATPPYETTDVVKAISNHSVDGNLAAISIEPLYSWNIFDKLNLNIGLNISYLLSPKFSQKEQLVSPNNVVFKDTEKRIRNEYINKDIPQANNLQFFGKTTVSYSLTFGKDMVLSPEFGFAYPFTKIFSDDWKVIPISIGLNLEYPVKPTIEKEEIEEIEYIRDTLVVADFNAKSTSIKLKSKDSKTQVKETDKAIIKTITISEKYEMIVPRTSKITGNLVIHGKDRQGNLQPNPTITIEEIEVSESFPLLPYIFFPEGSADLSKTSMLLLTPDEAKDFSTKYLPWETLNIYANLLNIIKERLDQNPTAKITINGNNSNTGIEANNIELSKARAMAIRDYLVSLGVNPERISMNIQNLPAKPSNPTTPDGIQENQRAEVASDNLIVLEPLQLSQIDKVANPPIIEIEPALFADLPIKNWNISITQDNKVIRQFSGTTPEKQTWMVETEPIPQFETPVIIKLTAIDEQGNQFEVEKSLKLTQKTIKKKREEIKNDTIYQRYSLIVFDFDKSELTEAHKNVLNRIRDNIKPNSQVSIYGYADRMGTPQYNKDLANRRIDEVVKYLKIKPENLRRYPIGSDELLYDNNTPQGRAYSRTVKIIIATPIK